MFKKLRKKSLQRRMNKLVKNMSDSYKAFCDALDNVSDLPEITADCMKESYWSSIDKEFRMMSLENRYSFLYNDLGFLTGVCCVIGFIFLCYVYGVI